MGVLSRFFRKVEKKLLPLRELQVGSNFVAPIWLPLVEGGEPTGEQYLAYFAGRVLERYESSETRIMKLGDHHYKVPMSDVLKVWLDEKEMFLPGVIAVFVFTPKKMRLVSKTRKVKSEVNHA